MNHSFSSINITIWILQARKALRALKGLVRLQAIIRGWAVRRQAIHTLKCLQTIVSIQSEFCAKRCDMVRTTQQNQEDKLQDMTEKDIKVSKKMKLAHFYAPQISLYGPRL